MEGVAGGNELELFVAVQFLSPTADPPHIRDVHSGRLCLREGNRLRFEVDCPHLLESVAQTERDLPSPAAEVEELTRPAQCGTRGEVVEQLLRIRQAVAVVERRSPAVQVVPEGR